MELTIIEQDPLNLSGYESFTPKVLILKNKENINSLTRIAAIAIGVIVLLFILNKINEINSGKY
ncbi:MAG: hypothetical protein QNK23_16470 [Crocinitomicaceae bacterium]|nr:hypothetical protein [Crocinitomicaceae bacterium]